MTTTKHANLKLAMIIIIAGITACTDNRQQTFVEPGNLHEGDIALRRGRGVASYAVVNTDPDGKYSHIGIIAKVDGRLVVVHSVPGESRQGEQDKVKIESLQSFFSEDKAMKGALMRFKGDPYTAEKAARLAVKLAEEGTPFDNDYDLEDTTRLYCTELIEFIYSRCGMDVTEGRRTSISIPGFAGEYILPSDIYKSSLFEVIYKFN